MNSKKLLAGILCVCLLLSAIACTPLSGEPSSQSPQPDASIDDPTLIAYTWLNSCLLYTSLQA